jgi:hypothetical protein
MTHNSSSFDLYIVFYQRILIMMMNNMLFSAIILAAQLSVGSAETLLRRRLAGVPVGPTACLTEEECRDRFSDMHTAGVLAGYFYESGNFTPKGCVLKGENVYFGSGGTLEEMSTYLTGVKERLWCESTTVELEMSMSFGLTDMSVPLETSEMSMSMGMTDMSLPLETSEMSMSLGLADMSVPLESSEMSMSLGLTDMSVPLETSEMSMSLGLADMSVPLETSEMSMSMGMTDMSVPLETSEMSMSLGLTDMSVPLESSEMSMSLGLTDMSVPLETSEMIMSIGITDMETSLSMGMTDMSVPLETSEMNMPEANAATVSPSSAPPEETANATDTNPVTGFFDNINLTSATDSVMDPVTDFFDNITLPFVNLSSGDDATKESATASGAVALSTWSHVACFISVTWYLLIGGGHFS